jgi:exopolyphosphatase/guanosine-5'-triphosphate,3'-diphosphate pyrophosphatase
MPRVFAATDIGSNTVHLLVAQVGEGGMIRLRNESEWLSLGQIVVREGYIPESIARRLLATLKSFKSAATNARAAGFYVFATEAMRLAENHDELLARIRRQLGIEVDMISPRREAELSLRGVQLDSAAPGASVLVEVGGGSAQVARCRDDGTMTDEVSLPLGTGRLMVEAELTQPSDPGQQTRLARRIEEAFAVCSEWEPVSRLIGSGGVARGLWRALHPDGDRTLHRDELEYLRNATGRLDPETICTRFGVKVNRAHTLLPGSAVYLEALRVFGKGSMIVSEFGVREGAILEMANGRLEACLR